MLPGSNIQDQQTIGSRYTKTYTSFSGIDITAMFDDKTMMTLAGISFSITREKAPVYSFGSASPRSISRGKRGIAGSLVHTLTDRDPYSPIMKDPDHHYYAHRDEVMWLQNPVNASDPNIIDIYAGQSVAQAQNTLSTSLTEANRENPANYAGIIDAQAVTVRREAIYADQVMPFDITLVCQNEYGQAAWCGVLGVEIINEGSGMSVDDITAEIQSTFIALHRETWRPVDPDPQSGDRRQAAETAYGRKNGRTTVVVGESGAADSQWIPSYNRDIQGNPIPYTG